MGSRIIAPGSKYGSGSSHFFESIYGFHAFDACRVVFGAYHEEIVVHDIQAFDTEAVGHEFFFGRPVVYKQDVGVSIACQAHCLPCTYGDYFYLAVELLFKDRDNHIEKPGIQRRRSGRQGDFFFGLGVNEYRGQ
jgi:hypothetical protein